VRVFLIGDDEEYRATPVTQIIALLGFIGLCLLVGVSAAGITFANVTSWYAGLTRPPLSPPNWLFGPVWTALYMTMAVAAWLVWRRPFGGRRERGAMTLWGVQLAINSSWTPVFFGLHQLGAGLAVMLAMFAAIVLTIIRFWPLSRLAGGLLLPYLAWVSFATYLNAGFWWLNR
jgi:tryptophan-rich sensory protein